MRALRVAVAQVLSDDRLEVATPEHQRPIEAFRSYSANKARRVRVWHGTSGPVSL